MTDPRSMVLAIFQEHTEAQCALVDTLMAIYDRGVSDALGVPLVQRKPRRKALPPCPYAKIVQLYHTILPELPGVSDLDATRKKLIAARWVWVLTEPRLTDGTVRGVDAEDALAWFEAYFHAVRKNDWIMGRAPRDPKYAKWRASIEILMKPTAVHKILEQTEGAS